MRVLFYYSGAENFGIGSLAAFLKSKGHDVDLVFDPGLGSNLFLNLSFLNRLVSEDTLLKKVVNYKPDIIAFSCITNQYQKIKDVANKIKSLINLPIIIGGIHPTSVPEEVIKEECFDIVCVGEGEEAFAELLYRLEKKESISNIKNLWVKDENKNIHKNEVRPLIKELDKIPYPDRSLFHQYGVLTSRIVIMTGRGCPFECSFCVNSFIKNIYEKKNFLRRRSVENVMEELIFLKKKYKPKAFRFEDDVFAHNLKWLKEFRIKYAENIGLPFHCNLTPTTAKDSILGELKMAGCESVSMGVQSGDKRIRENILKRHYSNEAIIDAAKRINKYGIKLLTEFIFGFPTETPKEMWESVELNEKLNAHSTASFIFYPFPKTELTQYSVRHGYLTKESMDEIIKTGKGSYHLSCLLKHPYIAEIYKFSSILPLFNKMPGPLKPLLRAVLNMKYGFIHKLLHIFSMPLIDIHEFIIRIVEIPKMIIKTRRVLRKI